MFWIQWHFKIFSWAKNLSAKYTYMENAVIVCFFMYQQRNLKCTSAVTQPVEFFFQLRPKLYFQQIFNMFNLEIQFIFILWINHDEIFSSINQTVHIMICIIMEVGTCSTAAHPHFCFLFTINNTVFEYCTIL